MGRKIFISYKYADSDVAQFSNIFPTTVRDYVDDIQQMLGASDHINKGENDGEDLSQFKDETIASRLRDKIYDSSITLVVVSRGMKESGVVEKDQWIPWEISYSLKEHSRAGRVSSTNAVLAIVLPDRVGGYDYYINDNTCPFCKCKTLNTPFLFEIMQKNMFNTKFPKQNNCEHHSGPKPYVGYPSYIHSVKWIDFKSDMNKYLEIATKINASIDNYEVVKEL
jgi:hypothetical protein